MPLVKFLDPELHLKAIEGYVDELAPEHKKQEAFYRLHKTCKRCQSPMHKEFNSRATWVDGELLPQAFLRCDNCGFLISPHTGVVFDSGNPAKIPTPVNPEYKVKF